jgi:hypothetical protein
MSLSSQLPSRRPAPQAPPLGAVPPRAPDQGPPRGVAERRHRRRGRLARLLTSPLPTAALEARFARIARPLRRTLMWLVPALVLALLAWAIRQVWVGHAPSLAPRHRAEALCFALAAPPPFSPPMRIEPSAALVRGRFSIGTPPSMALREAMQYDDRMVLRERVLHVGDYDVATAWLRLPAETSHRWLVVGWMEGADLAVCSFRFIGDSDELTPEQVRWGNRLLGRILVPGNFRVGALPDFRLHNARDGELPVFGPPAPAKPTPGS